MSFDDSSYEEGEEDGDAFEMAIVVIVHGEDRRPRLGSQFCHLYINCDRVEDHAKLVRDYFAPNARYADKYFGGDFICTEFSSTSFAKVV